MKDRIVLVEYEQEMKKAFITYAMSVIANRALPDVRDGLKPVHRRILYAMMELGLRPEEAFRKSARIVGDTMGKYHPHGDSAIYEAMVRMAQYFNMRHPLVHGHGNFGSIDGDPAAAMRYTEAKLSQIAMEMLSDLKYDVVDYHNNFDNSLREPDVLPSKFPNLLVNGITGIAVGMRTQIPPHNLGEVVNAVIEYIDRPGITTKHLMKHIKGPDFPTGGVIINKSELASMYEKGEGKIRLRANIKEEGASHGKTNLVITEIPFTYSGRKAKLIETLINMVKDRKLDELSDVRDESSKEGIRIILEVKKGINVKNLLNKLYKKTPLEDTYLANFLVLANGKPETLSLRDVIHHYVEFQKEITKRKYAQMLNVAKVKQEVLEGLLQATDVIDTIIEVLRGSKDVKTVRACLMGGEKESISFKTKKAEKEASRFHFSERQTDAILDMELRKLIQLEVTDIQKKLEEARKDIAKYQGIVTEERKLLAEIKDYLRRIRKNYEQERRTEITDEESHDYVEEVKEEDLLIVMDRFGYVKALELASMKKSEDDRTKEFPFECMVKNTGKIVVFTTLGNMYQVKVKDLPKGKVKDKGVPFETVTKMSKGENILWFGNIDEILTNKILVVTKSGMAKVSEGNELESNRSVISVTKMEEGDDLITVVPIEGTEEEQIVIFTNQARCLKFGVSSIPLLKKNSKGVKAILMDEEEEVFQVAVMRKGETKNLLFKQREIPLSSIPLGKKGEKGIKIKE